MDRYYFDDKDQFAEDVLKLLEKGSLNDVKIKLSDGEIFANKDILMVRSEYFATMLGNNKFIEGETNTVDMSHCSKAVMEMIIKFFFSGEASFKDLSLNQLLELSHMAKMLLLDEKFQEQLEEYIIDDVIIEGDRDVKFLTELLPALKYANQYNLKECREFILQTLFLNMGQTDGDFESSDSFKSLPFNLLRDIFLYDSDFHVDDEVRPTTKQRFDAFMIWTSENEVTEEQKDEIVESFDFDDFTVEELMTSIRDSGFYPGKKIDKRVIDLFKEQSKKIKK